MKVLVANRGEIALRVMRACRELGLPTVAVFADCDRTAPHVAYADEAYALGGNLAAETYLDIDALLDVARRSGADAVHPGYGFLSENAEFARACARERLTFVGPPAEVIERMGSKTAARQAAIAAGVPVVPGTETPFDAQVSLDHVATAATAVGYPVLVKAVAGGGGKGMRIAASEAELASAVRAARSEAQSAFGDSAIYLERRLSSPRHIEIQLLADLHGRTLAFVERECSIQRRYQKVVEESPSPAVSASLRAALARAAIALAERVGYANAGTIEFLVDETGAFYFLEMNTRLQVEHPVTEAVTGVDLVAWQLRIARGERLEIDDETALSPRAHAIECRIYAEDPDEGFMPSPGRISALRPAAGPGVRDDSGVAAGYSVPVFYDSMIAKLIAWAPDRADAISRMRRALEEYRVSGIRSTIPFFIWLLQTTEFREGRFDTTFLDRALAARQGEPFARVSAEEEDAAAIAAAVHAHLQRTIRPAAAPARTSAWKRAARLEALRS